jgi:aryl-alcohol dehydrogenase-like predicted oxidoreductase
MASAQPTHGFDSQRRSPPTPSVGRLALGTAQFGSAYGITNRAGKVAIEEARRIVDLAATAGIDLLDTAHLYGDSERVIGAVLPPHHATKIVTKTPRFADLGDGNAARARLHAAFDESLSRLASSSVYGLLVHDADDLLGPAGEAIWSVMEHVRQCGLVEKIGVSVYTGPQIEALISRYPLQIIQLPLNAVDGRLVRSHALKRLAEHKIEIHARSVFLQGLLLAPPETIDRRFGALRDAVTRMARDCASHGFSQIDAALAAVLAHAEVDRVVVGVTSLDELQVILKAVPRATCVVATLNLRSWEIDDHNVLNPATWPQPQA